MGTTKIVTVGGDFIGPEVIREGIKVLEKANELFHLNIRLENIEGGGQYYLEHGKEWEEDSFDICKNADAILFGAIGHPKARLPDNNIAGANIILGLRFKLDLFANIRPTKLYQGVKHKISSAYDQVWEPSNVNFTIIRENTEGLYQTAFSEGSIITSSDQEVVDRRIISREGSRRVIALAFKYAQDYQAGAPIDGIKRVTAIHKNNLLKGCQLFTKEFYSIANKFPKVKANDILVDSFCQDILRTPEKYSVCVTTNMFGDILTDLVSVLAGGMGMAPSGQINGWSENSHGMFEPIHGSAPDIAGKKIANPIGTILAVSMMFNWLAKKRNYENYFKAGIAIETAVQYFLQEGDNLPVDLGGSGKTSTIGTRITELLTNEI